MKTKADQKGSLQQLANALDVTPRRIQQLVALGMPKSQRGKYDLEKCLTWYTAKLKKDAEEGGDDYKKARAQRMFWSAKLRQLEYEERTGKLVNADEVKVEIFNICRMMRDALLSMPDRIVPVLIGMNDSHAMHSVITEEAKKILADFCRALKVKP